MQRLREKADIVHTLSDNLFEVLKCTDLEVHEYVSYFDQCFDLCLVL